MTDEGPIIPVGAPGDTNPDCIHCAMVPFVNEWLKAHPHVPDGHVLLDLATFVGEMLGSLIHNGAPAQLAEQKTIEVMREAKDAVLATMAKAPH